MDEPELRTARLELALPTIEDAAQIFAVLGDPRSVEHNPSELLTDLVEAEALVGRWMERWREHGIGYWCVREAGQSRVVGYSGLKAMTMREREVLNLVYRFAPDVWGRGHATEVARAVVAWGRDRRSDTTIVARVRPDNEASQRVAIKSGLQRDPTLDDLGEDGIDWAFSTSAVGG